MKYAILLLAMLLLGAPSGCVDEEDSEDFDDGCECFLGDAECTDDGYSLRICQDGCRWMILSCTYICADGDPNSYAVGCYYDDEVSHDTCLCDTWED